MSLREKVIQEIITTEETYLRQLTIIDTYFVKPCKEKELLPGYVHTNIFGELQSLQCMNKELYSKLTSPEQEIGKAFLQLAPFLKVYTSYANNFQHALELLQEWQSKNTTIQAWFSGAESRPEVQSKLPALLITPVQRVPRYRLLLEELLKHTTDDHPQYNDIYGALEKVSKVAEHINQQVRESESLPRLLNIQKALKEPYPTIIAPGRKLLKEGVLYKVSRSGKGSHPRLFFLFTDMLMYTKVPSSLGVSSKQFSSISVETEYKAGSLECCCVLPLRHCKTAKLFGSAEGSGITFKLKCGTEDLVLYSKSPSEGQVWLSNIQEAVVKATNNRKTLKKESSAKRPLRRPELRRMQYDPEKLQVLKATSSTIAEDSEDKINVQPFKKPKGILRSKTCKSPSLTTEDGLKARKSKTLPPVIKTSPEKEVIKSPKNKKIKSPIPKVCIENSSKVTSMNNHNKDKMNSSPSGSMLKKAKDYLTPPKSWLISNKKMKDTSPKKNDLNEITKPNIKEELPAPIVKVVPNNKYLNPYTVKPNYQLRGLENRSPYSLRKSQKYSNEPKTEAINTCVRIPHKQVPSTFKTPSVQNSELPRPSSLPLQISNSTVTKTSTTVQSIYGTPRRRPSTHELLSARARRSRRMSGVRQTETSRRPVSQLVTCSTPPQRNPSSPTTVKPGCNSPYRLRQSPYN